MLNQDHGELSNFFVFDANIPDEEGAKVDILFYYPAPSQEQEQFVADQKVGLCATFIYFCRSFQQTNIVDCDSICTQKSEFSLLEIGDNLWFGVVYRALHQTHRDLLKSVLNTCRDILFLHISKPKRGENGKFDEKWREYLQMFMPYILDAITWNDLVFNQLWDAYLPYPTISEEEKTQITVWLAEIHQNFDFINGIIVTHRDQVITFIGCQPKLVRMLTLLIFNKFRFYFPHKYRKIENSLFWTIGFLKDESGITNLYTPPINYNGNTNALLALQYNKLRLILLVEPNHIKTNSDMLSLNAFSVSIKPVMAKIERLIKKRQVSHNFGNYVGIHLLHDDSKQTLVVNLHKVQLYDIATIQDGVLNAHLFGQTYYRGFFPLPLNFYVSYDMNRGEDDITVFQSKHMPISDGIGLANQIISL